MIKNKINLINTVAVVVLAIGAMNISYAGEIGSISPFCIQEEQVDYNINTNGANVNMRSGPGTNYNVITKIPNNSIVTKISDYSNGLWAKTVYTTPSGKEYIGYVLYDSNYVQKAEQKNIQLGLITANRVVFRSYGSRTASKYGYFYKNQTVEILEEANSNGYYKIKVVNINGAFNNNIGYVHKDYVKLDRIK